MNRSTLARRYLPLALVVAVQALIIAVVPSTGPSSSSLTTGGPVTGYSTGGASAASGSSAAGASAGGGSAASGTTGSSASGGLVGGTGAGGTGGVGGTGVGGTGSSGNGAATGPAASPTAHCVAGREFSPAVDFYAPPCTPGIPGASQSNGGATYQGVSSNTITVVDYQSNYGAEVNTILQAEGSYESYAAAQSLDAAYQNFINKNYVLWGRKIKFITYQGKCQSVPPNYSCLLAEMDSIVTQYKPYAVVWQTSLCSACFARLAQDHTLAIGGIGFSDQFANANAPYFYASGEASSRMETDFASWWCSQLTSVHSSRKVSFAEPNNPAQNFNGKPRVLGVISTNDPDNEDTVTNVLEPALQKDCGDKVYHTYFYSQDINTAAQQVEAGISAMDTPTNPATDVLCLCDTVAPAFLYEGEASHNYWPENVLADVQGMTNDVTSQSYMSGLGCPQQGKCEYDDAFGLGATYHPQPAGAQEAGARIYTIGGGTGSLPVTGLTAEAVWQDYNMLASLIENTGPSLNPARMRAAAPSLGVRGGGSTGYAEVGFAAGDWNWTQDVEVVYWDKTRTSTYNGLAGTFVPIEGGRFTGTFPTLGEPPVPTNRP
ncbi:MAG TPA: hypothetical protein VMU63_06955 [Acidimicrobiales bacterium]|nr:hypothetical protein [Acidimicrobiales bacterium]